MKFKTRKKRPRPEFNTTALPDIIFMLLFFFMVATVLKTEAIKTNFKLPVASQLTELNKQAEILNIYLGKDVANDETVIQVKDHLIGFEKLENLITSIKAKASYKELIIALKADKQIKMHEINAVKVLLRKQNLRKITYVSLPGAQG